MTNGKECALDNFALEAQIVKWSWTTGCETKVVRIGEDICSRR